MRHAFLVAVTDDATSRILVDLVVRFNYKVSVFEGEEAPLQFSWDNANEHDSFLDRLTKIVSVLERHPLVNNVLMLEPEVVGDFPFDYDHESVGAPSLIIQTNHTPRSRLIHCDLKQGAFMCLYEVENE